MLKKHYDFNTVLNEHLERLQQYQLSNKNMPSESALDITTEKYILDALQQPDVFIHDIDNFNQPVRKNIKILQMS